MPRKYKFTPQQVIDVINQCHGLQVLAARKLHCSLTTIQNYAQHFPTVRKAISDNTEFMLDFAESKLFKLIEAGEPSAIFFFLKCRGKNRGYIERTETDITSKGKEIRPAPIITVIDAETRNVFLQLTNEQFGKQLEADNNLQAKQLGSATGEAKSTE